MRRQMAAAQADANVVEHAHLLEQLRRLVGAGDAGAGDLVRGEAGNLAAGMPDRAAVRPIEAASKIEDRALAGAVRADQTGDAAGLGDKREANNGFHAPEADRQVLY